MRNVYIGVALVALSVVGLGQKPKSQKEVDAINVVVSAPTADARIAAVDSLLQKFADTEFKVWALNIAANAALQKRDSAKAVFYSEEGLKADPKNYEAMIMLASNIVQSTREFDLDRDEKLTKADKYAKEAIAGLPSAPKPGYVQATDAQWDAVKKDMVAQAHEAMGMGAMVKKKYDTAIEEFKTAMETASGPEAATGVRLTSAYNDAGKFDDALATVNKVLAMADLNPAVKQIAESEKARAEKGKAAKK